MGLTFDKLVIILVIAAFLIGPERLPRYARQLGEWVRRLRGFADQAKGRMKDEMGEDFSEEDWRQLDPRQYDPRRIIRDALRDSPAPGPVGPTASPRAVKPVSAGGPRTFGSLAPGQAAPFDAEAT